VAGTVYQSDSLILHERKLVSKDVTQYAVLMWSYFCEVGGRISVWIGSLVKLGLGMFTNKRERNKN